MRRRAASPTASQSRTQPHCHVPSHPAHTLDHAHPPCMRACMHVWPMRVPAVDRQALVHQHRIQAVFGRTRRDALGRTVRREVQTVLEWHLCMYACMCACAQTCMYMCARTHVCTHACVCMCMHACVCAWREVQTILEGHRPVDLPASACTVAKALELQRKHVRSRVHLHLLRGIAQLAAMRAHVTVVAIQVLNAREALKSVSERRCFLQLQRLPKAGAVAGGE